MGCREIRFRISEWVDGDLKDSEVSEVEQHVRLCQPCCRIYDDFRVLKEASLNLPLLEPTDTVWSNIRAQLVYEGIQGSKPEKAFWGKLLPWNLLPRLSPAYGISIVLLTVILFGSTFYIYRQRDLGQSSDSSEIEVIRHLQDAERDYLMAIQALEEASKIRIESVEPRMAQILNDNLATIDYYVEECREAGIRNPGNPLIQKYLLAAYQKKVELLQSIVNSDVL